jgi:putative nucleotidyltransferase with HDIG domain
MGASALKTASPDEVPDDPASSEPPASDEAYVGIPAAQFISGSVSRFDVFVRLAADRYLKILHAGDAFLPARVDSYRSKGVTHFFIRRADQARFLQFENTLAKAALQAPGASEAAKVALTLSQGDRVVVFLRDQGLTPENVAYAGEFLGNLKALVSQMNVWQADQVGAFLNNVAAVEHGAGVATLAGVLAHVLEIRMDRPVQIVGAAALFHDIGIEGGGGEADPGHPARGAEILRRSGKFDAAVLQAVEQHHMRPHGDGGFPERNPAAPITRVAEIIGICDEFQCAMKREGGRPATEVLAELEARVFPGFSKQMTYAFRTAFFPLVAAKK